MKTVAASIAYFAVLMAVCLFGSGCATLSKVGDGKLQPVTKSTAKAALTAASVAAPEYAAVLKRIQTQVENYGETKAEADRLAGFAFTRTYFLDGNPIPDPARLTWIDKWEKTESAGDKTPPKESKETASVTATVINSPVATVPMDQTVNIPSTNTTQDVYSSDDRVADQVTEDIEALRKSRKR